MKRKFSRVRFYFINIFMGIPIFLLIAFMLVYFFCPVKQVTVEGTELYSKEDIEEAVLTGQYADNAVFAVIINTLKPPENLPFISKVTVRLSSYNSIRITLQEKDMIGFIALEDGNYAYFNEEGCVVEVSERILPEMIPVTGIVAKEAIPGEKVALEEGQLSFLMALFKSLKKYDIQISSCSFDESGNLGAAYGSIWLMVGKDTNLEEKIMRLPYILPQLKGQTGTLHLENWTPDNTDIVFERQVSQSG